ncbi:MAG: Crp/Fnr family transcriptional regulator [Actinomycetota bacterium]
MSYCLDEALWALRCPAWGQDPPPWAPGRREEVAELDRMDASEPSWCLSEVDIFRDLSPAEMEAIGEAAPRRTHGAGEILYSPLEPVETLFILKAGRVRIFRVAPDGRALTTALITPGTIFGEMVLLGQRMHDNFAEAIEEAVVCVMNRDDVQRLLLSDPRIAARIAEILGARLAEMERRLSDTVFKNVHQRIARSLATLLSERRPGILSRPPQVLLTHEQIAALVGTTRETATKVLGDLADEGLIRLSRGRITVIDPKAVAARAEE